MNMCQIRVGFVLVVVYAVVHTGYTLKCWQCNSGDDTLCYGSINVTEVIGLRSHYDDEKYSSNGLVHLERCVDLYNRADQKSVCVRRNLKGTYGHLFQRGCIQVSRNLTAEECPEKLLVTTDSNTTVDYCYTCDDYDGCNT